MQKHYPFVSALLLFLSIQSGYSQVNSHRGCVANEVRSASWVAPFAAGSSAFEQWYEKVEMIESEKNTQDNNAIYYIPVVVHVLHNGEAIGTERNLSNARIQSQIDILNNDFGKLAGTPGFNTHAAGADTRIRFCLAAVGPNGEATSGINRINTNRDGFDFNTDNAVLKNFSLWDTNKYLNLWSCKILGNSYIGYAQYPFITDSIQMPQPIPDVLPDGVVIEYRVFGDVPSGQSGPFPSYNKGRTATHEIGHYLGLIHIWGDGNSCLDNNATDYCQDTPKQGSFTSGCPASVNSCTTGVPAMFQNYMDYTNDACMNIFTNDQKKRMRIVMRNAPRRKTLFSIPTQCGVSATQSAFNQSLFSIYPTISSDFVELEQKENEQIESLRVFDLSGKSIAVNYASNEKQSEINIQKLPVGIFWVELTTTNAKIWRGKFVKQ